MRTINPAHTQALMGLLNRAPYFALLGMEFQAMEPGCCRLEVPLDYAKHGKLLAHGTFKLMVLEGKQSIHTLLGTMAGETLPPKFL